MKCIKPLLFGLILTIAALPTWAQYQFDSKKAEKLYYKLEDYYANYDYDKILANEDNIKELYLDKGDTLTALMYSFLGEAYVYWTNDLQTALDYYQKEYDLRKEIDKEGLANPAFQIGYIKDELGQYNETEEIYLEVMAIEEKNHGLKSEEYYEAAYALGDHYMFVEQPEKGLELTKKLKKIVDKNSQKDALVLKLQGDLYSIAGNYSKAIKMLRESLAILDDLGEYASIEYVSVMSSLAGVYNDMGKLPLAEEIFLEARSILERLQGDNSEFLMILESNMALNYTDLGNYDLAEEIYLKNLALDIEFYGENSYPYAVDAGNLADNYRYAGQIRKAEEYYKKSGEVYAAIVGEESAEYARILQNLANVNVKKGYPEEGVDMAKRALSIMEKVTTNDLYIATAAFNLGETYLAVDDLNNARKYHEQALKLRAKVLGTTHLDYATSLNKLAILSWRNNDADAALKYYKQTFDIYFKQINLVFPVLSEEEKTKFYYNRLKPAFEQYNSFIIETKSDDASLIGEMYDNQLATKGIILSATNKVRNAIMNSGDSVLIGKYETWIDQKEQLAKLFSAADMPVEVRNKKIDSLTTFSTNLEKEISQSSTAFASAFANSKLTWRDVKGKLMPGEAAVEMIRFRDFSTESAGVFTDEVYYAALIVTPETADNPELVILRNGKELENRYLSLYRNSIKYKIEEDYSYRLFWRPIANKLQGVEKIYFSPDGVYNQISIYTLYNPQSRKYLIDEIKVQVVTNTKDLLAYQSKEANNNKSYLFGYPNYYMGTLDDEDQEKKSSGSAASAIEAASENRGRGMARGARGSGAGPEGESLSRGGSLPRGLRGNMLRYMRGGQLLGLLPGTKKEVGLIDSLYQEKNTSVVTLLSNEALEDSIKNIKSPKTLHIATHGFFLEIDSEGDGADEYVENPLLRSGLMLAGANSFIATGAVSDKVQFNEDGILTAYEAMNLNLDGTELVVLSACETGLGEVKNGEGVYGLQRAFSVAGAEAMIMSMWTVDDDATQELMTTFYNEWLGGADKQEAFITAQKTIKEKWGAPYYWGAFVLVGN